MWLSHLRPFQRQFVIQTYPQCHLQQSLRVSIFSLLCNDFSNYLKFLSQDLLLPFWSLVDPTTRLRWSTLPQRVQNHASPASWNRTIARMRWDWWLEISRPFVADGTGSAIHPLAMMSVTPLTPQPELGSNLKPCQRYGRAIFSIDCCSCGTFFYKILLPSGDSHMQLTHQMVVGLWLEVMMEHKNIMKRILIAHWD